MGFTATCLKCNKMDQKKTKSSLLQNMNKVTEENNTHPGSLSYECRLKNLLLKWMTSLAGCSFLGQDVKYPKNIYNCLTAPGPLSKDRSANQRYHVEKIVSVKFGG